MQDIHQKLLATFQLEHRDHVEQIRALLVATAASNAPPAKVDLEEIFRRAHSLKGAARAVDVRPIEELAHRLETLFSRVVHGTCVLSPDVSRVAQQVLDASEDCIGTGGAGQTGESTLSALRSIEGLLDGTPIETAGPPVAPPANPPAAPPVPVFQPIEMVRISAENFDGLFRTAGSLVAESQRQDRVAEELDRLGRDIALIEKDGDQVRRSLERLGQSVDANDRARVSALLGSMNHRVRSVSRSIRTARRVHQSRSWGLRQLGKQLQRDVWQARMVPAESLLEGYRKMMRDLARDEDRKIEFRATSASVNADRRVLEALKDPIMHLLRNAVSHGIEPAAERVRKGKPAAGVVSLRIDTDGQRLTVTVEDDGRGVNLARVAEVAERQGIEVHSKQELTRVLFRAGFSTARAVTSLSGRGMGLSVVYEATRRLQGEVELRPAASGGAELVLSVPLSISSHKLMIVDCGTHVFAIPVSGIERLVRVRRSEIETIEGKAVIRYHGKSVLLSSIQELLNLEELPGSADAEFLQIVILKSAGQRIGLAVDAVVREADAVIQDLGSAAGCSGKIASGVLLESGGVAFVVNPMELLESALQPGARRRVNPVPKPVVKSAKPVAAPATASILVVDDSMTTRTLEKSILEAQGYTVRIAVDGVDALARLRQERADLVIADIEMPRLNGFGLIEAMKKDAKLCRIPVIIVSSVDRREDQERGLALGADAYIIKQRFDQQELLATVRQII